MKAGIHPKYEDAKITCACGRVTETRTTVGEIHVEICSHCHPFFTGRQKLVDTAGRVERFKAKYGGASGRPEESAKLAPEDVEPAAGAEETPEADTAEAAEPVAVAEDAEPAAVAEDAGAEAAAEKPDASDETAEAEAAEAGGEEEEAKESA